MDQLVILFRKLLSICLIATLVAFNPTASADSLSAFQNGLDAIDKNDFPSASKIFSELAKDGDPSSMHNLALALMMVGRSDEALYWFNKACRYGEPNSKKALELLGETPPPSDLIGKHPTKLQQEATQRFVEVVAIGVLIGVSGYYLSRSQSAGSGYRPSPSLVGDMLDDGPSLVGQPSRMGDWRNKSRNTSPDIGVREFEVREKYNFDPSARAVGTVDSSGNIEIRRKFDHDPTNRLTGTIDKSGDIELKNIYTQEKLKGDIDKFGEGKLKDAEGNTYKIELDCAPLCSGQ